MVEWSYKIMDAFSIRGSKQKDRLVRRGEVGWVSARHADSAESAEGFSLPSTMPFENLSATPLNDQN